MTARTAWTPGNDGSGLSWLTAINSADLASMINGNTVLSSVADIANGTNLDMFMDVSAILAIASSTIVAGQNLAFWLYALQEDGTTYGDGQLVAGTQAAKTPAFPPLGSMPLVAAAAQTTLVGFIQQIIIPPGSFRVAMQNNSGFTLTSGTQTVKYRTYNLNLNN
jgi:hypothetical protein